MTNCLKLILVSVVVALASQQLMSQDIVFTQFDQSPLTLNPAMSGVFDGKIRLRGNYRNQWSQILRGDAYNGGSLSVDGRVKVGDNSIGVGAYGLLDRAGELNFGNTQGGISIAFIKEFSQAEDVRHFLSFGQEVGVVQKNVDLNGARWPSQHDGNGGFDPTIEVTTTSVRTEFTHLDLTSGLFWISQFSGHNAFNLGIAVHHINRAEVNFFEAESQSLATRLTLHGGGEVALGQQLSLTPGFAYHMQSEHNAIQIGTGIRKYFSSGVPSCYLDFGLHIRSSNGVNGSEITSIIGIISAQLKGFSIGVSFDNPNNELGSQGTYNGAFELSLGYVIGAGSYSQKPISAEK